VRTQSLRLLDSDPVLVRLTERAAVIASQAPILQQMVQAGLKGSRYSDFVRDLRDRALLLRPRWARA